MWGSKKERAEITVFLSLIILIMLSFTMAVLESASIQVSKNIRRADTERAVESVFAEYQKTLLEEYDLFCIDGTYETGNYSENLLLDRLAVYGAVKGETQIEGIRFLSNQKGREFSGQIRRYIENKYGLDSIKDLTQKEEEIKRREEEIRKAEDTETQIDQEMDKILNGREEETPLDFLQRLKQKVLVELVLPKNHPVSQKTVEGSKGVSQREARLGKGTMPKEDGNIVGERWCLLSYIKEHFGSYIQTEERKPLEYEKEYLLGGKTEDMENMEVVLSGIRRIRFVPNYLYIQTDTKKKSEAKAVAVTVCTLLGNPELTEVVQQGILAAWAYGETIMDLRTLTAGGNVPAVKTEQNWKLSISGLLKLGTQEDTGNSEEKGEGMGYEDYLNILLLVEKPEILRMRMLDLIEWNMKIRFGCPFFQADACVTKIRLKSTCKLRRGITYQFSTYYSYQ